MVQETILQHWVFTQFILPFLLMFFIVFAILEKTKVLSSDNKQLNALVSFVIGLIFVGAVYPKLVVANLILFLTVAVVVLFIVLLLWGFLTGGEAKVSSKFVKGAGGALIVIAVILAVLWATGIGFSILTKPFTQVWSAAFWTNVLFVVVLAGAIALVLLSGKKGN